MQQRTTTRPLTVLFLVSLVLGSALGCARIAEVVKRSRGEAPPAPGSPTVPGQTSGGDKDGGIVKKTNFYITQCYNKYSNRIVESHNRYAMWVKNAEQGPTGRETLVYGLYDVSGDGSDCEKAIASAKEIEPEMPALEEAADNYVVALKEVVGQIRAVYPYYEQEDYKDDNFAKGKAAHANLMASFQSFKDANAVFAVEVDKLEDEVAQKELERLNDAGKRYEALVVESGIKAKKIKNLLQEKEFEQITADELNVLIEDFSGTVEALRLDNSKPTGFSYASSCDDFTKATKEMMRRIRDNKKFDESDRRTIAMGAGWMVDGSPQKVIKAYNDMIQRRSLTRF